MKGDLWRQRFSRRRFLSGSLAATAAGAGLVLLGPGPDKPRGQSSVVVVLAEEVRHDVETLSDGLAQGLEWGQQDGRAGLRAASGAAASYRSPVVAGSRPFTHVGLHWLAHYPEGTDILFEVQTYADGLGWSPWRRVYVEAEAGQAARGETYGALMGAARGRYIRYRAAFLPDKGLSPALSYVTLTLLNAVDGPRLELPGWGPTLGLLLTPTASAQAAKPVTFAREDWGADEGLRFRGSREIWPRMYVPTKKAVVHHTATGSDYTDVEGAKADVRAIYHYHAVTLGWGDIGYHCLVDKFGNSYEGRYGREKKDDPTGQGYGGPSGREVLGEDVVAGHASSHNYGTTGIALLGNFEQETPSAEALAKLREILSFECGYHGLDPRARSDFLRSDGLWTRGVIGVCGHREINVTACPGQNLYDRLPGLRDEAASRLANPSAPTVAITDGPDGVAVAGNTVSYRWAGSGSAYSHYLEGWSPDKGTGDVKYLTGFTPDKSPGWSAWEPTTTKGFSLPAAGHYTFHVRVRDAQGRVSVYQADRTMLKTSGKKAVTSWVFPVAK